MGSGTAFTHPATSASEIFEYRASKNSDDSRIAFITTRLGHHRVYARYMVLNFPNIIYNMNSLLSHVGTQTLANTIGQTQMTAILIRSSATLQRVLELAKKKSITEGPATVGIPGRMFTVWPVLIGVPLPTLETPWLVPEALLE